MRDLGERKSIGEPVCWFALLQLLCVCLGWLHSGSCLPGPSFDPQPIQSCCCSFYALHCHCPPLACSLSLAPLFARTRTRPKLSFALARGSAPQRRRHSWACGRESAPAAAVKSPSFVRVSLALALTLACRRLTSRRVCFLPGPNSSICARAAITMRLLVCTISCKQSRFIAMPRGLKLFRRTHTCVSVAPTEHKSNTQ